MNTGAIPKFRKVPLQTGQSEESEDISKDVHINALPERVRQDYLKTEKQFKDKLVATRASGAPAELKQTAAADEVVKHFRDFIRSNEHGIFHIYHGTHWQRDDDAGNALLTRAIAKGLHQIGGASMSYVDNVIKALRKHGEYKLHPEPEKVVPFENGMLDLNTKELIKPTPNTATRYCLPYQYKKEGSCEAILEFLANQTPTGCDKIIINYLAGILKGLHIQRFVVLVGQGGTGKSVFGKLATNIFGPTNVVTTDMVNIEGSNNRFETGIMEGKRFCMMLDQPQLPRNKPFNIIKKMTGGDAIRAEIKNGGVYDYLYNGGLLITCNQGIGGKSDSGMARRELVIPMNNKPDVVDPDLSAKLSAEIPYFVRYLSQFTDTEILEGLRQDNLPGAIIEANQDSEEQSNSVLAWAKVALTPCDCEIDPDCSTSIGNYTPKEGVNGPITDNVSRIRTIIELEGDGTFLFPSYYAYCQRNNIKYILSVLEFTKQLTEVLHQLNIPVTKKKDTKTRRQTFYGIKLKQLSEITQ